MKNREEKINNSVSGKEDVKLPEVGNRYRANFDNMLEAEIEYISKNKEVVMSKLVNVRTKITVDENKIHSMDKFIKYFVELPEDNIEIKPEWTKPLIVAVDEGKEGGDKTIYTVREGNKIVYCGEENPFPEKNAKSIWKDVSELPDQSHYIYLKWNDGEIIPAHYFCNKYFRLQTGNDVELDDSRIVKFCTLTDYINNTEERLKKLEGK